MTVAASCWSDGKTWLLKVSRVIWTLAWPQAFAHDLWMGVGQEHKGSCGVTKVVEPYLWHPPRVVGLGVSDVQLKNRIL